MINYYKSPLFFHFVSLFFQFSISIVLFYICYLLFMYCYFIYIATLGRAEILENIVLTTPGVFLWTVLYLNLATTPNAWAILIPSVSLVNDFIVCSSLLPSPLLPFSPSPLLPFSPSPLLPFSPSLAKITKTDGPCWVLRHLPLVCDQPLLDHLAVLAGCSWDVFAP